MSRKGKPFVVYKRSPVNFTIVPQGASGWLQFVAWMSFLGALVMWFSKHLETFPVGANVTHAVFLFCMGIIAWLTGGLWWMLARAEVVDVGVRKRDREMAERKRRLKR